MKSNIRNLRKEKDISQTELAKVIGKTQQAVSHMEKNRDCISIESLIVLSEYFGVSTDCVLGIKDEKQKAPGTEKDSLMKEEQALKQGTEDLQRIVKGGDEKILYELILSLLLCSLNEKVTGLN